MSSGTNSLDVMLRAVDVMTAWNDDPQLMGQVVVVQAAEAGDNALMELAVGLGHLCHVLLSRIEQTTDFSKQELLQMLAGVFIAEASKPDSSQRGLVICGLHAKSPKGLLFELAPDPKARSNATSNRRVAPGQRA